MSRKSKCVTLEEFTRRSTPCKNGRRCEDKDCVFLHNMKTRMCSFGTRCRRRGQCTFAHSEAELYVPECRFGSRCANKKCAFKHPAVEVEEKEVVNDRKQLEKGNFPQFVEHEEEVEPGVNYKEMKTIIDHVDTLVIASKDVEEVIDEYLTVKSFNHLTIKL